MVGLELIGPTVQKKATTSYSRFQKATTTPQLKKKEHLGTQQDQNRALHCLPDVAGVCIQL